MPITATDIARIRIGFTPFKTIDNIEVFNSSASQYAIAYIQGNQISDEGFDTTSADAQAILTAYQSANGIVVEYQLNGFYAETPALATSTLLAPAQWMIDLNWFYQQTHPQSGASGQGSNAQHTTLTLFSSASTQPNLPTLATFDGTTLTPPAGWTTNAENNPRWVAIATAIHTGSSWSIGVWSIIAVSAAFVQFRNSPTDVWGGVYATGDIEIRYRLASGLWTQAIPINQSINYTWHTLATSAVSGSLFASDPTTPTNLSLYNEILIVAQFTGGGNILAQQSMIMPASRIKLLNDVTVSTNNNLYLGDNAIFVAFDIQHFIYNRIMTANAFPLASPEVVQDYIGSARFNLGVGLDSGNEGIANGNTNLGAIRKFGQLHPSNGIGITIYGR